MRKYLIDTNIFLEILLTRKKHIICSEFLSKNIKNIFISDFSLHSIGVILFRNKKEDIFKRFVKDLTKNIVVLSLENDEYENISSLNFNYKLDFDDSYQTQLALNKNLNIVTLDKDFKKVAAIVKVNFL